MRTIKIFVVLNLINLFKQKNMQTFEIKEDHLKLLQKFYVYWDSCEYGAPAVDCKRPYGNSYVEHDIANILGWKLNEDEELTEEQEGLARILHRETQTALQICLSLQNFETGVYEKKDKYNDRSWKKIK